MGDRSGPGHRAARGAFIPVYEAEGFPHPVAQSTSCES